ncbi:hypothetical protein CK203_092413 [Vitis vinifera]|uniref:Reverse transcriptase zinc-binding domain-containing protein n=1 Tax=Vitis vinifera TaxID=29760 RepID=A0A438F0R5_VITVI|nr:hypothetical protein CK203_092413 [Vitis vinifera]
MFSQGLSLNCKSLAPFVKRNLRINLDKSEFIPVGSVENAEELVAAIGCKVGSLPTTYLGLPLGVPHRSLAVWEGVEERMRKNWLDGRANTFPKEGKVWGGARGLEFKGSKGGYGVGLWKTLRKEWDVVRSRLFFVVGNGHRDVWVKDVWRCNEGGGSWSPLFSRLFNDWELDEAIQPPSLRRLYGKSRCSLECYLCQRHEESIDHILLHCEKARTLWALLYSMFGVQWVLPATIKETLLGWNGTFVGKKRKGVWRASCLCLFG